MRKLILLILLTAACSDDGCRVGSFAGRRRYNPPVDLAGIDSGGGGGLVHGMTIPSTHPRIWFKGDADPRLATAKAYFVNHPISLPFNLSENFALLFAWVGLVTNVPADHISYCAKAITDSLTLTDAIPPTGTTACNECRWSGETVIATYDWCFDQLSPAQKTHFQTSINAWMQFWMEFTDVPGAWAGQEPSLGLSGHGGMVLNNFYWGYLRNEIMWGLASYGEQPATAEVFLNHGIEVKWQNDAALSNVSYRGAQGRPWTAGGVWTEGAEYGPYIPHYSLLPFVTAGLFGRSLYNDGGFWKQSLINLIYETLPNTYSNTFNCTGFPLWPFADDGVSETCGAGANGGTAMAHMFGSYPGTEIGDWVRAVSDLWASTNLGKYGEQWVQYVGTRPYDSYWLRPFDTQPATRSFSNLPLDFFAWGSSGFAYSRTAWDDTSTAIHLITGWEATGHEHADWGTWQMWRGGRWLSRETVGYVVNIAGYNGTGDSQDVAFAIGHNALLINPDHQGCVVDTTCSPNGGGVRGNEDFNWTVGPTRIETKPGYFFASTDISGSYRNDLITGHIERQNPAVKSVVRDYVFVRDLEALVILDRIETLTTGGVLAANMKDVFLAHCELNWNLVDSTHSRCTPGNSQELSLTTLLPAGGGTRSVVTEGSNVGQYRLEITDNPGTAQRYFLHVIQGRNTAGLARLAPTLTDNGGSPGTWTVTLDGTHSVTLQKGMASAGGSVTLSGVTTSLRADVQSISVDDTGPIWGP